MFGAMAKAPLIPPTTSATGKMKPTTHSPAEPQSRRASPQGAWASRPPSTHGRDGSPQPSEDSSPSVSSERSVVNPSGLPQLQDAISRLVEAYRPQAIWLFGSQARGDASPDSDYDLMVIVDDNADRQHRKSELAYRVLRSLGRAIDVAVWRRSAFQEQARSVTSLPATILSEGILVYAA